EGLITGHRPPPTDNSPSAYLRMRCPLCFGGPGQQTEGEPDFIVCLDACFTQKRAHNPRQGSLHDPINPTTSVFLSEEELTRMETHVETLRPSRQSKAAPGNTQPVDKCEEGMRVPASVLDGCNDTFTAADEKRTKPSTRFFADTGLMALLCRHDRVLWLCNMTSSGEKQHYALALIAKLLEHLPSRSTLGVLYDVACQLERSCRKFNLLSEDVLSRISFAVSVFHAYGHQWPCQLVYHPRKRQGFGLSDGEGCERLWSALKFLISVLRVSGFHQRLFVLDNQVRHLDARLLFKYGEWLHTKWSTCRQRMSKARGAVVVSRKTTADLHAAWLEQVQYQTRPLPRTFQSQSDAELTRLLALENTVKQHREDVRALERWLVSDSPGDSVDIATQLTIARDTLSRSSETLRRRIASLGTPARIEFSRLKGDIYLQARMEALAVKTRIRDRLRQRKFEMSRVVERPYRESSKENNLSSNIETSMKKREPAIKRLVVRYNSLCCDLERMIAERKAPSGSIAPARLIPDSIWQLDVDDDIWQDVGLAEASGAPPDWLSNDAVRSGIRSALEIARCEEEERRLILERRRIQEWFSEEWKAVNEACNNHSESLLRVLLFLLLRRRDELTMLYAEWEPKVRTITCTISKPWGPTSDDI
ncbi:hypothetical protein CONPUDRAFT_18808, partial [Coniophora puteana RWD-64-598 SS2]